MKLFYRFNQILLIIADLFFFNIGLFLALSVRNWQIINYQNWLKHLNLFLWLFLIWLIINYINELYILDFKFKKYWPKHIQASFFIILISFIFTYLFNPQNTLNPKTILVLTVIFSYSFSLLFRLIFNLFLIKNKNLKTNILFLGYSKETQEIIEHLLKNPQKGYNIQALIDLENKIKAVEIKPLDLYKKITTLKPLITNKKIKYLIVDQKLLLQENILNELYQLLFWDIKIKSVNDFYEKLFGRIPQSVFSENWFLNNLNKKNKIFIKTKRILDIIIGVTLLSIFIITYPIIALLIKLSSKGPIFFKQQRYTKNNQIFNIYKYRTMFVLNKKDNSAEISGVKFATKNDKRITKIGKFLRRTRLDELPQAINILKGQMSIVGPRPERPEIVEDIEKNMPYYSLRHIVKPGLTGWATIKQNYADSLNKNLIKLQYDLYYIKHQTILLDLLIILKTIKTVFSGKGQ